jgi:hypothetical protein
MPSFSLEHAQGKDELTWAAAVRMVVERAAHCSKNTLRYKTAVQLWRVVRVRVVLCKYLAPLPSVNMRLSVPVVVIDHTYMAAD